MVALLVVLTILVFLTLDYFVQRSAQQARLPARSAAGRKGVLRGNGPRLFPDALPAGTWLDPSHTWARPIADGSLLIGTDLLPGLLLGEVGDVELAAAGASVRRGDPIAMVGQGDRTLTLRSPVDGRVTERNLDLADHPSRLASEPFGSGWLLRIDPVEPGALSLLLRGEVASLWARREIARLRELLQPAMTPATVGATLPDGGEPLAGIAQRLDQNAWEGIEKAFFLPSPATPIRMTDRKIDPFTMGED
jgi:glycine cleavage system H protein